MQGNTVQTTMRFLEVYQAAQLIFPKQNMASKENVPPDYSFQRSLRTSRKMNSRSTSFCSGFTCDMEMEKEYLEKLKTQRQKTEKLYSEYIKLKEEKEDLKQNYEQEGAHMMAKYRQCQEELQRRVEQCRIAKEEVCWMRQQVQQITKQKVENLNQVKITYEQTFAELKQKICRLTQTIESKNKQISLLKKSQHSKIKQQEREINTLRQSIRESQQRLKICEQKSKQSERMASDWNHKHQAKQFEILKMRKQYETKNKQITNLKKNLQRVQTEYQSTTRLINNMEERLLEYEEQIIYVERERENYREKYQEVAGELKNEKSLRSKIQTTVREKEHELVRIKEQTFRKEEIIKEYQTKIISCESEEWWRSQFSEKEQENYELLDTIKNLRQENDSLMGFIRQKQNLEKERRYLVEHQFEEITKFQAILRDVN